MSTKMTLLSLQLMIFIFLFCSINSSYIRVKHPTQDSSQANINPLVIGSGPSLFPGRNFLFWKLLQAKFNTKVVGGIDATIDQAPWQVSLTLFQGYVMAHFCGGSIISSKFVLTAAHCCDVDV